YRSRALDGSERNQQQENRGESYVELQSRADSDRYDAWNRPLDARRAAPHRYQRIGNYPASRRGIAALAGPLSTHGQIDDGTRTPGPSPVSRSADFPPHRMGTAGRQIGR